MTTILGSIRIHRQGRAVLLLGAALLASCVAAGGERGGEPEPGSHGADGPRLVLSSEEPAAVVEIGAEELEHRHPVLSVSLSEVRNPERAGFDVFVELASGAGDPTPTTVPLGHFSVYPADRPADFLLRADEAYAAMERSEGVLGEGTRLRIEARPIHGSRLPASFEVVIGSLRWLDEPE
jgi:hypothetical protein